MTLGEVAQEKSIIGTGAVAFANGHRESMHVHVEYAQLKWPSTGIAKVRTPRGIFVADPGHAVWIPAGERHGGIYAGDVLEKSVYVHARHLGRLPVHCCLIEVSPALGHLLARTIERFAGYARRSRAEDLSLLSLLDREVVDTERKPVDLVIPEHSPLELVFETLLCSPSDLRTLADWATQLKMAERSLTRKFRQDTGHSFGEWRKRARALLALERLCAGANVRAIAKELGYESVSAFVHMFRTTLGTTPTHYYRRA
jgi:AraC-like DNA-binding protein